METGKILVTGATGTVGREIIALLHRQGIPCIAAVRDPETDATQLPAGCEIMRFDFEDEESIRASMSRAGKLFLMRPPAISDPEKIRPAIEAAKRAGLRHIVFLSLMGVEKNPFVPHHRIEAMLTASGIPCTFLRPSFFMQNLATTHRDEIRLGNEIFVPAGRGRTSFIDTRDIAAVAMLALTQGGHANKAYELSGSKALSYYEAAEIFTRVLDRKISYKEPGAIQFYRHARQKGFAPGFALVMLALYTVARLGMAGRITDDVRLLLGREAISFEQFVKDYKSIWQ